MSLAPWRLCAQPGCAVLVRRGRCARHRRQQDLQRGSATERGYNTTQWRVFRARWLGQHRLCGERQHGFSPEHSRCWREGRRVWATDVDPIVPLPGPNDPRFFDLAAVQSLCHRCHGAKTARERAS